MHTMLLAVLASVAVVAAVAADSPKRYQLGDVEAETVPEPCKNGNPKSCRQVRISCNPMKYEY